MLQNLMVKLEPGDKCQYNNNFFLSFVKWKKGQSLKAFSINKMAESLGNRHEEITYVYELPFTERKQLCNILDMNKQWEILGKIILKLFL